MGEVLKHSLLNPTEPEHITITLPNFFVSFLAETPQVNPHYECVKVESEKWLAQKCQFDEKMQNKMFKTDFSYFCAISAPEAAPTELRTLCDWGNWVFPFDDMFDNGCLKENPAEASQVMGSLLSIMCQAGRNSTMHWSSAEVDCHAKLITDLVAAHDTVWLRVVQKAPRGVQRRFAKAMESYCAGALNHVKDNSSGKVPSIEEMIATRRQSAGVAPLFALVEYAHQLDIPDEVLEDSSVKEIQRIGTDLVLLQNDILSYQKEEVEGVTNNLVAVCRMSGMPAQQAFDHVASFLDLRYRDWYLALAAMPKWGEPVDSQIQKYIQGVKNVVLANLNWSFKSRRYLGDMCNSVRETGTLTVMRTPPYLASANRRLKVTFPIDHERQNRVGITASRFWPVLQFTILPPYYQALLQSLIMKLFRNVLGIAN